MYDLLPAGADRLGREFLWSSCWSSQVRATSWGVR